MIINREKHDDYKTTQEPKLDVDRCADRRVATMGKSKCENNRFKRVLDLCVRARVDIHREGEIHITLLVEQRQQHQLHE